MKYKKQIFISIVTILTLILQVFITYDEFFKDRSYLRHCKVIKRIDYIEITKHKSNYSSTPERAFIIQWLDSNTIDEIEVTPDTYFTTKEGDNIAFTKEHKSYPREHPFPGIFYIVVVGIAYFVEAIALIWFCVWAVCYYIFDYDVNKN